MKNLIACLVVCVLSTHSVVTADKPLRIFGDCNSNGVNDSYEFGNAVNLSHNQYNFAHNAPLSVTFNGIPPTSSTITIKAQAICDCNGSNESVDVYLDGTPVGVWTNNLECPGSTQWGNNIVVDSEFFNSIVTKDSSVNMQFNPRSGCANICGNDRITVYLEYQSSINQQDLNSNGVIDSCELDCNSNSIPDDWDIQQGFVFDCNANGIPDECDICNGTIDPEGNCQETPLRSTEAYSMDCNFNNIPDECEIADGSEEDTNNDNTIDICQCLSEDVNGDEVVDISDINILIAYWGTSEPIADINNDNIVDVNDLMVLIWEWGPCGFDG